jgi:hypothetical protein
VYYDLSQPHRNFSDLSFSLIPINNLRTKLPANTELINVTNVPLSDVQTVLYSQNNRIESKSNIVCTPDLEHFNQARNGFNNKSFTFSGPLYKITGSTSDLYYGANHHYNHFVYTYKNNKKI